MPVTLGSSGGSYCTIQSTSGISSPLAATSVHNSIPESALQNWKNVVVRLFCFCLPQNRIKTSIRAGNLRSFLGGLEVQPPSCGTINIHFNFTLWPVFYFPKWMVSLTPLWSSPLYTQQSSLHVGSFQIQKERYCKPHNPYNLVSATVLNKLMIITYVNGQDRQIDVVQQLVVVFHGHTG